MRGTVGQCQGVGEGRARQSPPGERASVQYTDRRLQPNEVQLGGEGHEGRGAGGGPSTHKQTDTAHNYGHAPPSNTHSTLQAHSPAPPACTYQPLSWPPYLYCSAEISCYLFVRAPASRVPLLR